MPGIVRGHIDYSPAPPSAPAPRSPAEATRLRLPPADLRAMSLSKLGQHYNVLVQDGKRRGVALPPRTRLLSSGFADRPTALRRIAQIMEALSHE
jgi:hypothetical protein